MVIDKLVMISIANHYERNTEAALERSQFSHTILKWDRQKHYSPMSQKRDDFGHYMLKSQILEKNARRLRTVARLSPKWGFFTCFFLVNHLVSVFYGISPRND